jgi:predicted nucleic acid-binding protein
MEAVVVDTDVLSCSSKTHAARVIGLHLEGKLGFISFMTIAELEFLGQYPKVGATQASSVGGLPSPFRFNQFRPVTGPHVGHNSQRGDAKRSPHRPADCWIAATALRHGVPLLTHNHNHFAHVRDLITISEQG